MEVAGGAVVRDDVAVVDTVVWVEVTGVDTTTLLVAGVGGGVFVSTGGTLLLSTAVVGVEGTGTGELLSVEVVGTPGVWIGVSVLTTAEVESGGTTVVVREVDVNVISVWEGGGVAAGGPAGGVETTGTVEQSFTVTVTVAGSSGVIVSKSSNNEFSLVLTAWHEIDNVLNVSRRQVSGCGIFCQLDGQVRKIEVSLTSQSGNDIPWNSKVECSGCHLVSTQRDSRLQGKLTKSNSAEAGDQEAENVGELHAEGCGRTVFDGRRC